MQIHTFRSLSGTLRISSGDFTGIPHLSRPWISELLSTRKIGGDRSGTGDVFSSIVTGALIQGQDFKTAVKRAVTFLDKAIAYTAQMELPWNYGICFEEYLEEI